MNKRKIEAKSASNDINPPQWIGLLVMLPLLAMMHLALAQTVEAGSAKFDHMKTGFNLAGPHAVAQCDSCHVQGIFKGTPRDCASCHRAGNRMGATSKPNRHIATMAPCDSCHRSTTWTPATFSHVGVVPGACMTCHNGSIATGKPNGHIFTLASCDGCHRTSAWLPAGYDHRGVAPGTCTTCHGVSATGKPSGHVATSASCDKCHSTTAWLPASYDHTGVVPGTCATCHNGVTAKGVGGVPTTQHPSYSSHVPTSLWPSCDSCHKSTVSFTGAYVHKSVAVPTGSCTTCHSYHNAPKSCDSGGCHSSTNYSNWSN
jgi:hypothetical protein